MYQYTLMHGKMLQFELRASIKFCITLGKTGGETGWMMQGVCQEECMFQPHIYKCYQQFKAGREEDDCEGTPVTVRSDDAVVHAREIVSTDCRLMVYAVAEKVSVSYGTCHKILHYDLNMHCVCGYTVPKNLTEHQLNGRAAISSDLIDMVDSDLHFLNKLSQVMKHCVIFTTHKLTGSHHLCVCVYLFFQCLNPSATVGI
jgi:hypothetical protein